MTHVTVAGVGAVMAFIGVAAGAFGAHALEDLVSSEHLSTFEVGVRYQMYHALALFALGCSRDIVGPPQLSLAAWAFIVGIVLFSGSLYVLSLTGIRWLGAITPLGGLAFLAGWAICLYGIFRG